MKYIAINPKQRVGSVQALERTFTKDPVMVDEEEFKTLRRMTYKNVRLFVEVDKVAVEAKVERKSFRQGDPRYLAKPEEPVKKGPKGKSHRAGNERYMERPAETKPKKRGHSFRAEEEKVEEAVTKGDKPKATKTPKADKAKEE